MAENNRSAKIAAAVIIIALVVIGIGVYSLKSSGQSPSGSSNTITVTNTPPPSTSTSSNSSSSSNSTVVLQVVAGENFWGSLVSQLCGIHCNVTSIVTDPNTDPHEFESNAQDARMIANANYVIVNGVGYDDWALQLLAASNNPNRTVLNVADYLGVPNGSNPHLWYNPTYVNATVKEMYMQLVKQDPSDAPYFATQYANVTASLYQVDNRMTQIREQFGGTKVGATESIFVYLANATGLDLVSPPAFMEAVAEGNDPPTQSVIQFQNQLENGSVTLLVYNEQTVTPITTQMKQIAIEHNITIVGVTETIQPQNVPFETWMNAELLGLQNGLNANALGS